MPAHAVEPRRTLASWRRRALSPGQWARGKDRGRERWPGREIGACPWTGLGRRREFTGMVMGVLVAGCVLSEEVFWMWESGTRSGDLCNSSAIFWHFPYHVGTNFRPHIRV